MLFIFFFCILFLVPTVYNISVEDTRINNSCNAPIIWYSDCTARVESVRSCTSAIVNFTNTPSAQCVGINFLWAQFANNLTMILETPFTKTRQAYRIIFDNNSLMEGVTNLYQIINNKEIVVTTHTSTLTLNSDSNYQVIVKFQAPAQPTISAIGIRYQVAKV